LEEGIPVSFIVGSFLEKAMLASCPAVVMPVCNDSCSIPEEEEEEVV
jgi:hypothetical protein